MDYNDALEIYNKLILKYPIETYKVSDWYNGISITLNFGECFVVRGTMMPTYLNVTLENVEQVCIDLATIGYCFSANRINPKSISTAKTSKGLEKYLTKVLKQL